MSVSIKTNDRILIIKKQHIQSQVLWCHKWSKINLKAAHKNRYLNQKPVKERLKSRWILHFNRPNEIFFKKVAF